MFTHNELENMPVGSQMNGRCEEGSGDSFSLVRHTDHWTLQIDLTDCFGKYYRSIEQHFTDPIEATGALNML